MPLTKEQVIGKVARRQIRTNRIITDAMVEVSPMVRRGEIVQMVYETDKIKVVATAEAREQGQVGDIIRVRNTVSRKEMDARILSDSKVEVLR